MQSDQQIISQLEEAARSTRQTLDETKLRHKSRILALRGEQQRETQRLQGQIRGYEKALKAITKGNGQGEH